MHLLKGASLHTPRRSVSGSQFRRMLLARMAKGAYYIVRTMGEILKESKSVAGKLVLKSICTDVVNWRVSSLELVDPINETSTKNSWWCLIILTLIMSRSRQMARAPLLSKVLPMGSVLK